MMAEDTRAQIFRLYDEFLEGKDQEQTRVMDEL